MISQNATQVGLKNVIYVFIDELISIKLYLDMTKNKTLYQS